MARDGGEVLAVEAEAGGAEPVVVAGQAVPVDGGPEQVGAGGSVGLGERPGGGEGRRQQRGQDQGRAETEPLRNS